MANYIVQDTSLATVADAIRSKAGISEKLVFPDGWKAAVDGIQTGGGTGTGGDGAPVVVNAAPIRVGAVASVVLPSGVQYYYNHELLPEIPTEIIEGHKHVLITKTPSNVRIYSDTNKPYYSTAESGYGRIIIPTGAYLRATLNTDANAWVKDYSAASSWLGVDGAEEDFAVWWSNYDVPKGSQDATEIYFPACGPKTEKPADATHFYYNGRVFPKIPDEVASGGYEYIVMLQYTDGSAYLYCTTSQPYSTSSVIKFPSGRKRYIYNAANDAWEHNNTSTSNAEASFSQFSFMWSNCKIPSGSATATSVYRRGTVAVPVPTE